MRTLYDNAPLKEALAEAGLPVREFFTFTTERGDELNGYMLKPLDFDPAKRYPVLLTQYSGPGSQQVAEGWGPDWEDALVTHGYIVVCVDPRGTGYRGCMLHPPGSAPGRKTTLARYSVPPGIRSP